MQKMQRHNKRMRLLGISVFVQANIINTIMLKVTIHHFFNSSKHVATRSVILTCDVVNTIYRKFHVNISCCKLMREALDTSIRCICIISIFIFIIYFVSEVYEVIFDSFIIVNPKETSI